MSELADALLNEASDGGVAPAEIPQGVASDSGDVTTSQEAKSPEKPEKISLREQINKSVEAVRKEEATRARDTATGKFAKVETPASAEKPAAAEIPKPDQNAQPAESNPTGPPSAWAKIWDGLTPEAKAIAVKREAEVAKGFEEYRSKVKQYDAIEQVLAPARARFQQQGAKNDAEALNNIISWEQGLNNPATKVAAYRDLGRQLGIDLSTLVQSPPQPSTAQDIPEPLRPVIDQFGNIVQRFDALETRLQQQDQNSIAKELTAFAKDKPHFEKVRVIMGQLMNSGLVPPGDLDTAYQKAILHHPEVSAQIEAERAAKAQAELAKTNAEKAARARQAAVSPSVRSPNGAAANGAAKPKSASVRESILSSVTELREGQRA